jgi:pseudaminic acid cytidylyltransferase
MNQIKRLLIIPARSGSKRIKNKNIKKFHDQPIIYYPLKVSIKSKIFDKIHVSTDSTNIANVVNKLGRFADFLRPKNLSSDNISLIAVLEHVINKYEAEGINFDEVWSILPCSPLLMVKDILKCKKLIQKNKKTVLAVSPYPAPINWSFQIKNNKIFKANEDVIRDSKLSKINSYYDSGQIYCFPINIIKKKNFSFKKSIITYKLPIERSVDIDTKQDWKLAEILYKGLQK